MDIIILFLILFLLSYSAYEYYKYTVNKRLRVQRVHEILHLLNFEMSYSDVVAIMGEGLLYSEREIGDERQVKSEYHWYTEKYIPIRRRGRRRRHVSVTFLDGRMVGKAT